MAEVAAKKSINVVSTKKGNEVCSVQSNNGLIDLDNITASNNQLISLCDNNEDLEDDLVLANNTRNELGREDKSLQELIESELALRINSNVDDEIPPPEEIEEPTPAQPETVKVIVLDRRDSPVDVNAEFIIAERAPYGYQNGHVSPETKTTSSTREETVDTDPIDPQTEEISVNPEIETPVSTERENRNRVNDVPEIREPEEDEKYVRQDNRLPDPDVDVVGQVEEISEPVEVLLNAAHGSFEPTNDSSDAVVSEGIDLDASMSLDKFQQEEELVQAVIPDDTVLLRVEDHPCDVDSSEQRNSDLLDTWADQVSVSTDGQQTGQFSDNFEEALCQQQNSSECPSVEASKSPDVAETNLSFDPFVHVVDNSQDNLNDGALPDRDEDVIISSMDSRCRRSSVQAESKDVEASEENKSRTETSLDEPVDSLIQIASSPAGSEISPEAASTREFLDTERRVLNEEFSVVNSSNVPDIAEPSLSSIEIASKSEDFVDQETGGPDYNDSTNQDNIELSREQAVCESTNLLESFDVVASETNVTEQLVPEYPDSFNPTTQIGEEEKNLDSWMTVEEATTAMMSTEQDSTKLDEPEKQIEETFNAADKAENIEEPKQKDNEVRSDDQPQRKSSLNLAPLATPDEEISDVSFVCDSESREETITTSSSVVTSSSTKTGAKTKKKKKIEGVAGNDASSPNLTPRTKKTKKSKKNDLEKENISVNGNAEESTMRTGSSQRRSETIDFSDEDDLSNVNVKSLTQNYVSEANRAEQEKYRKERIATGVSIKQLCRSFGDISNMADTDQTHYGKSNHTMDAEEKARSMGDLRVCEAGYSKFFKDSPVFTGVSVKALRASYCSLASIGSDGKEKERAYEGTRFEKSSFNKFDALSKKTVLHVRSVDAGKVQQQLNAVGQNGDTNPNCRSCGKVVFQMEQTKAEGLVWHKNCFRCVQCGKQLNVDNYESHESTLYCKAHFKELFQPKPVEESDQPVRPRKPELIIRENEPKELPPDVVRASDKPDLGLEELSSLNVKSRFQVFEKAGTESTNEIERSPSQVAVKRSPSILSKLAKFQAKGMDIGVADESLNGIPFEESSESEEEEEIEETEETETEIVKSKRSARERPMSFSKMDDIKNRWESTSQQGRRETQREARKEEIAGIRSRLFMGKQGKMKEMYQQAVAGSERVTKINAAEEIQHTTNARSIKERFERGEPIAASDDEMDSGKPKPEKADEEVIAAGISRKSRSLFLELDASAAKTGRPVTPVNPSKTPGDAPRRARDAFMGRQVSDDVVRSTDATEEVHVQTSDISNKFKFFESYKEPEKQRRQFRITPPRDGQVKMDSPEREIYRDPEVVRADDRVDEVVRTDTARKMLSIFRQMEEKASKEELPDGPKPLKRFTPPPEDKYARQTASDSEDEEDEEGEESDAEESNEERDPNYVRASDKVEDEFLKQAQTAARAKTLRAKFEHWEETDGKVSSQQHVAEMEIAQSTGDQSSIESASSLRARFESLGSQVNEAPRTPKVKVNRFVEIQTNCMDVCESCQKKVYPLEKVETNNKIFHKQCFRCLQCNCILRMDTFTLNNGKLYCIPHFKQLFITRGNYDEGFGVDPHKNKWANNTNNPTTPPPIAVSNGEV